MAENEALAFLECVLPAEGCYIAVILDGSRRAQIVCPTVQELARVIIANDAAGRTTYHACASFKDPKGIFNQRTQKWEKRSHANVLGLRCLFADIDCGPGKAYPDTKAAYVGISGLVARTGLPWPLLVSSGSGFHCYWLFDQTLAFETWSVLAVNFKRFLINNGLKIDPTRTADASSILRTPGTHNRKHGAAAPVQCYNLADVQVLRPEHLQRIRETTETDAGFASVRNGLQVRPLSALSRDLIGAPDFPPSDIRGVIVGCGQIRRFSELGNLSEPGHYAAIGVVAFAVNGRNIVHEYSKRWCELNNVEYDHGYVDQKIDRVLELSGATTCAKFASLDRETCSRCSHFGRIKSPISLGYGTYTHDATVSTDAGTAIEGLREYPSGDARTSGENVRDGASDVPQLPQLPKPFLWSSAGQLMFQQGSAHDDSLVNVVVTDQPVFIDAVQTGEINDGVFSYRFRHNLPHKGWNEVTIEAGIIHGANGIAKMAEKGVVVHDSKLFMNYVRATVDNYHKKKAPQTRYEQYGWKRDDTCFLFGRHLYTAAGKITVGGNEEVEIRQRWLGPRKGGSLLAWTETCDKLFQHQMEALAATVLASPAAALIKFCSALEGGAVLHLFTPGSGKGKTTALQGGWTFWGEKFGTSLTGIDTKVSKPIVIGTLANLPVFHDELIDRDPEVIKKFVEMFTEGRDRMRGTQTGGIRHVLATWNTVLLTAANKSLVELLPFDGTDAAGFRVLELTCVLKEASGSVDGDKMKRVLEENAGHAAERFVSYLVAPGVREWCQQAIDQWMKDIWDKTKLGNEHRFRVRLVAAIAVAGMICYKLEILNFSPQRIVDYLLAELVKDSNAGTVSKLSPIDRASQALGEFLNEHQGQVLIVADAYRPRQQPAHAIVEPKGKLSMRCELRSKRLYVSQTVFKEWCAPRGLSARMVIDTLAENRVVIGQPNKTLTAGTHSPGSQVPALEINMEHPLMSGFAVSIEQLQARQAEAAGLSLPPRA